MKRILVSLMLVLSILSAVALAETTGDGALYAGIDPWGNPISVSLTSEDTLSGVWTQNFGGDLFTQAFENAQDGFSIEGPLGDSDYITCRYTGTMNLDSDVLSITFTDGEMTEASTEGGSTSYHVAPLDETQRSIILVPAVPGDYSGVTTLDAAKVEAFAAWVRQLYLNEDWDAIAQMISYPITMYPDVEINDADAFVTFMADKTISESDIEAMSAETWKSLMPAYYETALKVKYVRDDASAQMIDIIHDSISTEFAFVYYATLNNAGQIYRTLVTNNSNDFMSTWAKLEKGATKALDKLNAAYLDNVG